MIPLLHSFFNKLIFYIKDNNNNNNNNNNNFIYIALISWAHGALQCKKWENEVIYISQKISKIYLQSLYYRS